MNLFEHLSQNYDLRRSYFLSAERHRYSSAIFPDYRKSIELTAPVQEGKAFAIDE